MTDNEIIKAFECCNSGWCDGRCPYYGREDIADCREQSGADQLDLIYRQQAALAKLQGIVCRLKQYDEERDIRLHARLTEKARAEAIKEFAERLKSAFDRYGVAYECYAIVDTVASDMAGGGSG